MGKPPTRRLGTVKASKMLKPPLLWITYGGNGQNRNNVKKLHFHPIYSRYHKSLGPDSSSFTSSQRLTWHKLQLQSSGMCVGHLESEAQPHAELQFSLQTHHMTGELSNSQGTLPGTRISLFILRLSITQYNSTSRGEATEAAPWIFLTSASCLWIHWESPKQSRIWTCLLLIYICREIPSLPEWFHTPE